MSLIFNLFECLESYRYPSCRKSRCFFKAPRKQIATSYLIIFYRNSFTPFPTLLYPSLIFRLLISLLCSRRRLPNAPESPSVFTNCLTHENLSSLQAIASLHVYPREINQPFNRFSFYVIALSIILL